jgi:hypothetical protein
MCSRQMTWKQINPSRFISSTDQVGDSVRMRVDFVSHAPPGIGTVQLLSGIHRNVSANGTIETSESDTAPLLRAGWTRVEDHKLLE